MTGLGWKRIAFTTPQGHRVGHLVPLDDLEPHTLAEDCRCRPNEDAVMPDYWAHNAFDRREDYEDGRKLH